MPLISTSTKTLQIKIVYYGPGLSGKTTNLEQLNTILAKERVGEMMSLDTKGDRTLFFDWMPLDLGKIRGFDVRVQLYTVPGQVRYNKTRQQVLRGVDGIVFVADSQKAAAEQNLYSYNNLRENLIELGLDLEELPVVIQCNKKDLPETMTTREMAVLLSAEHVPFTEAVSFKGNGVSETLRLITRHTLKSVQGYFSPTRMEVMSASEGEAEALDGESLLERILLDDGVQQEVQDGEDEDNLQEISAEEILAEEAEGESLPEPVESKPEAHEDVPAAAPATQEPPKKEESSRVVVENTGALKVEERVHIAKALEDEDDSHDVEKTPIAIPVEDYMTVKKPKLPSLDEEFSFRKEQSNTTVKEASPETLPQEPVERVHTMEIEAEPPDEEEMGSGPIVVREIRKDVITKEHPSAQPDLKGVIDSGDEVLEVARQVEQISTATETKEEIPVENNQNMEVLLGRLSMLEVTMPAVSSRVTVLEQGLALSEKRVEQLEEQLAQRNREVTELKGEVDRMRTFLRELAELTGKFS